MTKPNPATSPDPLPTRRRVLRWSLTASALSTVGPLLGCGSSDSETVPSSADSPTPDSNAPTATDTVAVTGTRYEYDYKSIAPLAMLADLPDEELPAKAWLLKVGIAASELFVNMVLIGKNLQGPSAPDELTALPADHPLAGVFPQGAETLPAVREAGVAARIDRLTPAEIPAWFFRINDELSTRAKATAPNLEFAKYDALFQSIPLPDIALDFESDASFANLRVAGPNPTSLFRVPARGLPSKFPVTDANYLIATGGTDSLADALRDQRLYMLDFAGLSPEINGSYPSAQKYGFEPLALFAVPPVGAADRSLMPIAIQCGQDPLTWPVVLPTEGEAWMQAKTVVQIADADYYQLGVHVARTHLLVEPFPIATHNQLPSEHPLRRLLEPHFEGTLFVNAGVASTFLNPGGFADTVMSGTVDANRAVTLKSVFTRGFRSAYLPGWLANQGLDDPLKLPVYPFRDDALLIWGAIGDWIRAYVGVHWPDDATVVADTALQAWAREVTAFDGGRVPDFGEAANGEIRTRAYLERALQMIVWTASGMHAALNFPQGTVLTYTPAMPFAGYTDAQTPPPTTQADVLRLMPPLDQAIKQLNGQYLGGAIFHTRIGEYAGTRFEDTTVQAALRTFRERLLAIELIIDERNQRRRFPYEYLRPTRVPESINI